MQTRVEQPPPAAVESDSDESIELIPVPAKKQGITVLKQGNVIIKNWERNFKMANRSITNVELYRHTCTRRTTLEFKILNLRVLNLSQIEVPSIRLVGKM